MNLKKHAPLVASLVLIVFAALTRILPHPWNFTAVGALALFSGAYLSSRWSSVAVTLAALFLTDLVLGFHSTMPFVYGAFAVISFVSHSLLKEKKWSLVGASSLASSLFFYLVSNFGVWTSEGLYAPTPQGLVECYIAGIPFLQNQILGDLFFVAVLFGTQELLQQKVFFRLAPKSKV